VPAPPPNALAWLAVLAEPPAVSSRARLRAFARVGISFSCDRISTVRRRFFVEQFAGQSAVIEGETGHHLGRVLRAQQGQLYELSDGSSVRLGRIETVARDRIEFALLEEIPSPAPPVDITLLLSIVKFDAFEWAIEKATELGVGTIVPVAAARSEKALLVAARNRADRWRKIIVEASQQSRRVRVPGLAASLRPEQAFSEPQAGARVMLSERSEAVALRDVLADKPPPYATLAIGPEGGWTDEEVVAATAAGFRQASLGKLILRTETAVIASLACLNYALGV
jgi:16S rRNA (uracil1498-N3)-methyltransferase